MRWERLALDSIVLGALALLGLVLGWLASPALLAGTAQVTGLSELVFDDAYAPWVAGLEVALACAAPFVLAWVLGLEQRVLASRALAAPVLAAVAAALALALPVGLAWQVYGTRRALAELDGSLLAMLTVSSLDVGGSAVRMAFRLALVIALVIGVRARTPR